MSYLIILIAVFASYAVISNLAVYFILLGKGVKAEFMWAGTPGYLYHVCVHSPNVSKGLRYVALSTNIAFVAAMLILIFSS